MYIGDDFVDILEAILTRRSVRSFTGDPVGEEDLKSILKAGFAAPSAHNYQPWHFIVIKDNKTLEKMAEFHTYGKMLPKAGCAIVVCGDKEKQPEVGFLVEDCSASIENMLLAAHGLGYGAVWCGLYPMTQLVEDTTRLLNLPGNIIPVGVMPVGCKKEDRKAIDKYDESKIHWEKW
jgi:nitroreductase